MSKDREIYEFLKEDWLELESDPGIFTLLIEDFGVKGVAVEEVYDISEKPKGPVYGFVFLSRWSGKGRRRKGSSFEESYVDDPSIVNDMFFAYQITPNSCATYALLSVLLNCNDVELGPQLTRIKEFCHGLDPESKGYTIASSLRLARSHNRYASRCFQPATNTKQVQYRHTFTGRTYEADTFHYVSYVPIGDRLFELDGLKRGPIDHGPWGGHEEWTDLFLRKIAGKIYSDGNSDIHFSLMAVVVDNLPRLSIELEAAHVNLQNLLAQTTALAEKCDVSVLQEHLCLTDTKTKEICTSSGDENNEDKIIEVVEAATKWLCVNKSLVISNIADGDVTGLPPSEPLQSLLVTIAKLIQVEKSEEKCHKDFLELLETRQRYYNEFVHRSHNYFPMIEQFLSALSEDKQLCLPGHANSVAPCKKRKAPINSNKGPSKKLRAHLQTVNSKNKDL